MDSLLIPFSIFCAFYFFFFNFLFLLPSFKKSPKTSLPPAPSWKLPLIGHIHHILGSSLPHQTLRDMATKHGLPVMYLKLGETSSVIISSPEATKEVMKTHDAVFANRPYRFAFEILFYNATDIAFSSSCSYWSQLRKICSSELLSSKRVQSFRFIREEEVSEVVKTISENEGSQVNLSKMIMSMTNAIVARAAFGKRSRYQEAFLRCAKKVLKLAGRFYVADFFPSMKVLQNISGMKAKLESLHIEIDRILENIIDDHRNKKKCDNVEEEDLVDAFLKIQEQNDLEVPISVNNIKATILDIFIAGTETSATTVAWAMSEMLKQPKILVKAQTEVRRVFKDKSYVDETKLHQLEYLKCVIKETLRLHPAIPLLLPRKNKETCEINGYKIPANTTILVNAWAIGRDPKYWSEAEEFKPERFSSDYYNFRGTNFEYIPFGSGRRICPGIAFATPNVELPLASLLYHFDWKLPNGMKPEEFDMSESFVGSLKKKLDLCLIPVRVF